MELTEKERTLISKIEKMGSSLYLNYIATGILFCLAIFGLIIGIKLKAKDGFLMALYFGTMAIALGITTSIYKKLFNIIIKLKECSTKQGKVIA